jgi:hypothetical protein
MTMNQKRSRRAARRRAARILRDRYPGSGERSRPVVTAAQERDLRRQRRRTRRLSQDDDNEDFYDGEE